MGNFYTSITLTGGDQASVASYLSGLGRSAYVSQTINGSTAVFDEECDKQDISNIDELSAALSRQFRCAAWSVLVHDDDVLRCGLYVGGEQEDEFNSSPSYFDEGSAAAGPSGGSAEALCQAFGKPGAVNTVEGILRKPHGAGGDPEAMLRMLQNAATKSPEELMRAMSAGGYIFEVQRHVDLLNALDLPQWLAGAGFNCIADRSAMEELADQLVKTP